MAECGRGHEGSVLARRLSLVAGTLGALAAGAGLAVDGLYRDNVFVASAWRGNDLVTAIVAVPMLVVASQAARRGSSRGGLIWLAMLDYLLYTYAYYLFGARFNELFLVYAAVFTLSAIALIAGLLALDAEEVRRTMSASAPVAWVVVYMLVVAAGLTAVYVSQSIAFIVSGNLPAVVELTEHPTSLVFALDLSLLVPGLLIGAVWLWQRRAWGYVLAAILTVKGAVYTLALAVGSAWAGYAGVEHAFSQIPLWLSLSAAGTLAAVALLWRYPRAS